MCLLHFVQTIWNNERNWWIKNTKKTKRHPPALPWMRTSPPAALPYRSKKSSVSALVSYTPTDTLKFLKNLPMMAPDVPLTWLLGRLCNFGRSDSSSALADLVRELCTYKEEQRMRWVAKGGAPCALLVPRSDSMKPGECVISAFWDKRDGMAVSETKGSCLVVHLVTCIFLYLGRACWKQKHWLGNAFF